MKTEEFMEGLRAVLDTAESAIEWERHTHKLKQEAQSHLAEIERLKGELNRLAVKLLDTEAERYKLETELDDVEEAGSTYRERCYVHEGGVYLIRDVMTKDGEWLRCEYATKGAGPRRVAVAWTECAQGVDFDKIKPMVKLG